MLPFPVRIKNQGGDTMRRYPLVFIPLLCACFFSVLPPADAVMSNELFFEICEKGPASEIETALQAGANVNAVGERGRTPIMSVAKANGSV